MSGSKARGRVIWLVWDAAAAWVVLRLLAEGALPALGSVASSGFLAATRPPRPNAETPPSLATLFSGVDPAEHGISAFHLPAPARGPLDVASAFAVRPQAPLAWEWAAAEGWTTALAHAPWSFADGRAPQGAQAALQGFDHREAKGGAVALGRGERSAALAFGDDELEVTLAAELVVRSTREGVATRLPSEPFAWRPWALPSGRRTLLGAARRADGRLVLMHTGAWRVAAGPGAGAARVARAAGTFVGEGLGRAYRSGAFGPTLLDDGDGTAEGLLLRTLSAAASYFERCATLMVREGPPADLVVAYQPAIDDVSHELIGLCDPSRASHRPSVDDRAWSCLRAVYGWVDRGLGAILAARRPGDHVVVASDHGMGGVDAVAHLNEALAAAGLLTFDAAGLPDLARSAAVVSQADGGSLWIDRHRLRGDANSDEADELLARAERALRACRDHAASRAVVADVRPPAHAGDARVVLAPGFQLAVEAGPGRALLAPARKTGSHSANAGQSQLHGIVAASGPAVRPADIGAPLELREVWPLVRTLLPAGAAPRTPRAAAGALA